MRLDVKVRPSYLRAASGSSSRVSPLATPLSRPTIRMRALRSSRKAPTVQTSRLPPSATEITSRPRTGEVQEAPSQVVHDSQVSMVRLANDRQQQTIGQASLEAASPAGWW